MKRTRWLFQLILAGVLAMFVATSVIPAFTPTAYAQGPFGSKRQGTTDSNADKEKEAKERKEREEREKAEKERQAREQADRERREREQAEAQRQAREREERERQAREQEERQRREREAQEARERYEREQAEKQRQAQEQADRERREREAQAERDRQAREQQAERDRLAREQAERDRIARENAEKEKQTPQPASVFNKSSQNDTVKRTNEPIQPTTQHRSSDKYTRVQERPRREEPQNRERYRPPDYYPYDPGYRRELPDYYPVPIPEPLPEPVPVPQEEPEVIVIDRGPIPEPETQIPDPEPEVETTVQSEPELEPLPDAEPEEIDEVKDEEHDIPEPVTPMPEKWAKKPEIPKELKLPVQRGSGLETLNHISLGWLTGDIKLIKTHIDTKTPVRIYKKGKYSHKLTGKEFIELTADAMKRMNTREFKLKPINTKNGKVYAMGSHVYVGLDGVLHKTLLNYTLKKVNGVWTVVEVGFSPGLVVTAKSD